ncbi:MAG: tRNA-dihydrouridine synthase, partial [Alcanivoracaceae bacterium]
DVRRVVLGHLADLHGFYGEQSGVRIARKHLGWYSANLPGGETFRRIFNRLESATEQWQAVEQFFLELEAVTDRVRFGRYGVVSPVDGRDGDQNGAKAA